MEEKLDSISKILIATGTINYLANLMFLLNKEMKMLVGKNEIHTEGIVEKDKLLENTVKKLGEIMEELGDCLNKYDAVMPIDERITSEAFKIMHGDDSVNK